MGSTDTLGAFFGETKLEQEGDEEVLGGIGGDFGLTQAKEIIDVNHHIMPVQGTITLDNRREAAPGKGGKGPTKRGAKFPVIISFELDSQEARMGRVEGQGSKGSFDVGDGSPSVLVHPSKNVSDGGHLEVRSRRRGGVRRMAKWGRGVGN